MKSSKNSVLAINGGSSSIKFSMYKIEETPVQVFSGEIENIGLENTKLYVANSITKQKIIQNVYAADHIVAANFLIDWLEKQEEFISVRAIGHRIVQGMKHTKPGLLTSELLNELKKISAYDPDHLPGEIKLIEVFRKRHPKLAQIGCFDTSFHAAMPTVAKLLSIPRRYFERGIHRYGFHGISYSYLMEELKQTAGSDKANGKIILAHLGNGASLAAVKDGKGIDTSMGFTPASGLPMGTRTGDLDPGVAWYLLQNEKLTPKQFSYLINHESGLLGVSETGSDMRELLKIANSNQPSANNCKEAIELFCYQTKKWIGSYAAVLGGLETLVFSGGIGENAPEVRTQICSGLQFLGIELDERKNKRNDSVISAESSNVCIRVIKTNEELMIARAICKLMKYSIKN